MFSSGRIAPSEASPKPWNDRETYSHRQPSLGLSDTPEQRLRVRHPPGVPDAVKEADGGGAVSGGGSGVAEHECAVGGQDQAARRFPVTIETLIRQSAAGRRGGRQVGLSLLEGKKCLVPVDVRRGEVVGTFAGVVLREVSGEVEVSGGERDIAGRDLEPGREKVALELVVKGGSRAEGLADARGTGGALTEDDPGPPHGDGDLRPQCGAGDLGFPFDPLPGGHRVAAVHLQTLVQDPFHDVELYFTADEQGLRWVHLRRSSARAYSGRMTVRVVFADDNYLVREGVAALLSVSPEVELLECVGEPEALYAAVARHRPDAVLTDIRMPPTFTIEGIEAAKRIRAEFPETGVVVLSQHAEADYAFELLSEGVAGLGYLLKERVSQVDDLVRALYDVARGGSALDPTVVEALLARKAREAGSSLLGLTSREHEVLQELAAGRSNSATAKALFMSERAVEKHVGAVFQKLGLVHESEMNRRVVAVLAFLDARGATGRR